MAILVLFIDSFPYYYLERTEFMRSIPDKCRITPSFGYSVNLHAELFAGLKPDDLGFFGEWSFDIRSKKNIFDKVTSRLSFIRKFSPFADRALHVLLNKYLQYECANIPFDVLYYFSRSGRYLLQSNSIYKTLFEQYNFTTIVSDFLPLALGKKDGYSYTKVLEAIKSRQQKIFVSFPDLDGISHKFGVGSPEYDERVDWIDSHIDQLAAEFLKLYPKGNLVILSDHGMVNATQAVNLQLERVFGKPKLGQMVYFYDSLYLRIWVTDKILKREVLDFLTQSHIGSLLSQEERSFWGISDKRFGDIIFLLKEGYAFAPNYFGLRLHKAYHGYYPELESQQGIFLYLGNHQKTQKRPKYLIDVYHELTNLLKTNRAHRSSERCGHSD